MVAVEISLRIHEESYSYYSYSYYYCSYSYSIPKKLRPQSLVTAPNFPDVSFKIVPAESFGGGILTNLTLIDDKKVTTWIHSSIPQQPLRTRCQPTKTILLGHCRRSRRRSCWPRDHLLRRCSPSAPRSPRPS